MPRKHVYQPVVVDSLPKHKTLVHITFCGRPAVSTGIVNLRILFGMSGFVLVEENHNVSSQNASYDVNSGMYKLCKRINKSNHDCFVVEEGKSYWVAQIDEALTREWLTSEMLEMEKEEKQKPENIEVETITEVATSIPTQVDRINEKPNDKNTQSDVTLDHAINDASINQNLNKAMEQYHDNKEENVYCNQESLHYSNKKVNNNDIDCTKANKRKRRNQNRRERKHHQHHRARKAESTSTILHDIESVENYNKETEVEQTVREQNARCLSKQLALRNKTDHPLELAGEATNIDKSIISANRKHSYVDNVSHENITQNINLYYEEEEEEQIHEQQEQNMQNKYGVHSSSSISNECHCNNKEQEHLEEYLETEVIMRKRKSLEKSKNANANVEKTEDSQLMRESNDLPISLSPTLTSTLATNTFTCTEIPVSSAHKVCNTTSNSPSNCVESNAQESSPACQEKTTILETDMIVNKLNGSAETSEHENVHRQSELLQHEHQQELYDNSEGWSNSSRVNHHEQFTAVHDSNEGSEVNRALNEEEFVEINLHHATPLESPALMFTPVYNQLSAEFSLEPSSASSSEDEFEERHHSYQQHYSHFSGMHRKYLYDDDEL